MVLSVLVKVDWLFMCVRSGYEKHTWPSSRPNSWLDEPTSDGAMSITGKWLATLALISSTVFASLDFENYKSIYQTYSITQILAVVATMNSEK